MRKYLYIVITLLGIVGVILSLVMLMGAFRFGEWGRFFLYVITLLIGIELSVVGLTGLIGRK